MIFKHFDIMLIDLITPIVEDAGYTGGIQDFGAFV